MSKLQLKNPIAEHISVGLMTVLIDMPYDIIGIKYIHWVWHDTDPNICKKPNKIWQNIGKKKLLFLVKYLCRRSSLLGAMEFLLFSLMFLN